MSLNQRNKRIVRLFLHESVCTFWLAKWFKLKDIEIENILRRAMIRRERERARKR